MIMKSRSRQFSSGRFIVAVLVVGTCLTACGKATSVDSPINSAPRKTLEDGVKSDNSSSTATPGDALLQDGDLKKLLVEEKGILGAVPRASVGIYTDQAKAGDVEAQTRLAVCYYIGQGVGENKGEAKKWFTTAAEANDNKAQYCLAYLLEHGEGGPADKHDAYFWYQIAAEGHDRYSKRAEEEVKRLSADFDEVERGRVRKEVLDWFNLSKFRKTRAEKTRRSY